MNAPSIQHNSNDSGNKSRLEESSPVTQTVPSSSPSPSPASSSNLLAWSEAVLQTHRQRIDAFEAFATTSQPSLSSCAVSPEVPTLFPLRGLATGAAREISLDTTAGGVARPVVQASSPRHHINSGSVQHPHSPATSLHFGASASSSPAHGDGVGDGDGEMVLTPAGFVVPLRDDGNFTGAAAAAGWSASHAALRTGSVHTLYSDTNTGVSGSVERAALPHTPGSLRRGTTVTTQTARPRGGLSLISTSNARTDAAASSSVPPPPRQADVDSVLARLPLPYVVTDGSGASTTTSSRRRENRHHHVDVQPAHGPSTNTSPQRVGRREGESMAPGTAGRGANSFTGSSSPSDPPFPFHTSDEATGKRTRREMKFNAEEGEEEGQYGGDLHDHQDGNGLGDEKTSGAPRLTRGGSGAVSSRSVGRDSDGIVSTMPHDPQPQPQPQPGEAEGEGVPHRLHLFSSSLHTPATPAETSLASRPHREAVTAAAGAVSLEESTVSQLSSRPAKSVDGYTLLAAHAERALLQRHPPSPSPVVVGAIDELGSAVEAATASAAAAESAMQRRRASQPQPQRSGALMVVGEEDIEDPSRRDHQPSPIRRRSDTTTSAIRMGKTPRRSVDGGEFTAPSSYRLAPPCEEEDEPKGKEKTNLDDAKDAAGATRTPLRLRPSVLDAVPAAERMYVKSQLWLERKECRRWLGRVEADRKAIEGCSFHPRVYSPRRHRSASAAHPDGEEDPSLLLLLPPPPPSSSVTNIHHYGTHPHASSRPAVRASSLGLGPSGSSSRSRSRAQGKLGEGRSEAGVRTGRRRDPSMDHSKVVVSGTMMTSMRGTTTTTPAQDQAQAQAGPPPPRLLLHPAIVSGKYATPFVHSITTTTTGAPAPPRRSSSAVAAGLNVPPASASRAILPLRSSSAASSSRRPPLTQPIGMVFRTRSTEPIRSLRKPMQPSYACSREGVPDAETMGWKR